MPSLNPPKRLAARFLLIPLFLLGSIGATLAQDRAPLVEEYRQFLMRMGFEDYAAKIEANRKLKNGIAPTSDAVLAAAQSRYSVMNSARDLSAELASRLAADPKNPTLRQKMVEFTAEMLRLKPAAPDKPIPKEIIAIKDEALREEKLYAFAAHEETEILKKHITHVSATALDILGIDAKTVRELDALKAAGKALTPAQAKTATLIQDVTTQVGHLVSFAYLDAEMGQTQYLGRALALSTTKVARETKDLALEAELKASVAKKGMFIENFVGKTHIALDEKGKQVAIKIENGALLLERSSGAEAGRLIAGSRPPWERTWPSPPWGRRPTWKATSPSWASP